MPRKPFRTPDSSDPQPLRTTIQMRVRFDEVDMMGVTWHGRYISYFEEARIALGKKYGISYDDFIREKTPVPIRQLHLDYVHPLKFDETISIEAVLHYTIAARMDFEFIVRNADRQIACTGYSVQLMLDSDGELLLAPPRFFQEFLYRWKAGELD